MLKDPKRAVIEVAKQVGKHETQRLLVEQGVSTSTAQKLVADKYPSKELGQLLVQAIVRAVEASKKLRAS